MKTLSVEIKGIGKGYLQHKRNVSKDFERQVTTKRTSRQPSTLAEFKQEAIDALYQNELGPYIPSKHIEGTLVDAGKSFQIAGQGKKTYKKEMMASIIVVPNEISIKPSTWETDIQAVKLNGKSQIFRARPLFKSGWTAEFDIEILDDEIQTQTVEDILKFAGRHTGIGDYRPKYGQFEITKISKK